MKPFILFGILTILVFINPAFAQTGKISGTITDASTGEPLIGANILIQGTAIGAATNVDGYYSIISVSPGTYTLRISNIGYTTQTIIDVRVSIDQTTEINAALNEQTIETEEVIVVATAPIVQQDVSASTINLSVEEIESLPVTSIASVITLQAGIRSDAEGPLIRGGDADQTAFVVNGITLRDERDNTPYTGISFTSIEEVQIQTGGFNAEYGNIRSGLVNVITKEGKKDRYSFAFLGRYRPAGPKHFGDSPHSPNSYWVRPYIDPAVAFTGTNNGAWDEYTQNQYQIFRGWNQVSKELLSDNNPNNDLTPEAAQQLFLFQHRKVVDIDKPDYDLDMSLAGPVPGGEALGDLRFAASYRNIREMYFIPLSRDSYQETNYQLKLTSNLNQDMKLSVEGLLGKQSGTNSSRSGGPGLFRSSSSIADDIDIRSGASFLDSRVFATDYWAPSEININIAGAKFTHVLSQQTFYEVTLNRVAFEYDTNPGTLRDTSKIYQFGNSFFDEAPFGAFSGTSSGIGSSMNMGLGFSNSRDSSKVATWTAKFDLASQLDEYNYFKAGAEFIYTDNNVNYALIEPSLPSNNSRSVWQTFPIRAAVYIQDKLEFEGMIANLGLRLDYSDPGGTWYQLSPFDRALTGENSLGLDTLAAQVPIEEQLDLSPRLGIAFPISINSKLFFNYGHFRSMPIPEQLFLLRRSTINNQVVRIANPNNPLPKTVAYELGYEHNLFDQLLIRVAGYYKDISDEPRLVTYTSRDNSVRYEIPEPNRYQDTRGFEITLSKNRGDWVRGFINYTYEVTTFGFFGLKDYSENPATQREIERNTAAFEQTKAVPQPYARANIDFFTPYEFGPELGGFHLLEDITINLLATYSAGRYFSWTGPGSTKPGFPNNIQWADFYNVDMRLSKGIDLNPIRLEFFMDITNLFDIKYLSYRAGFVDANDFDEYMKSLHLPDNIAGEFNYGNIPGDDKPGDFDKDYVDQPNLAYAAFLNPRDIYWGLKLIVEL